MCLDPDVDVYTEKILVRFLYANNDRSEFSFEHIQQDNLNILSTEQVYWLSGIGKSVDNVSV